MEMPVMKKFTVAVLLALPLLASEGKWTPEQVLKIDPTWLRKEGLQLPPDRLWDARKGTGLLAAAVSTGGCSASFVSESGLIITNHHCLFGILQEHSTTSNDIISHGFLAQSRDEELPSKTTRITVPRKFTDVTREVLAAVPQGATDAQRFKAIESAQKRMVAECEKQPASRCQVAVFDDGMQYMLIDTMELSDIRLVYAPPRAIGEYGGEIDNWTWPRHTGDFSMARAYVGPDGKPRAFAKDNVPYKPAQFLPISAAGIKPGDFVMALGYPGRTYRSLTAAEMEERRELTYPRRVDVLGEYIRILEETTKGSPEGQIAVASMLKGLNNVFKNAQGQIAGFDRGHIVEKQRAAEDEVVKWALTKPRYKTALEARQALMDLLAADRKMWERDFLLDTVRNGSIALSQATTLVRLASERAKPDAEREPTYMNRMLPRMRDRLEREQKNLYAPAEKALLAAFFRRVLALPDGQRVAAVDALFADARTPEAIAAKVETLYSQTTVTDLASRLAMFNETPEQLKARHDALLDVAFELDAAMRDMKERTDARAGAMSRLRPLWRAAVLAHAGKPVAPDANGTLRVSFAHVEGYQPRDGVIYRPFTTLAGVVEKNTGEEPFAAPKAILDAARATRDPAAIPVNFLADADTTGGNSGSPMVNGRGELVGLNFDRVWENVANDFGYNPDVARNVSVDIRYLLWILENVSHGDALLHELGVKK
jgi:hypothetical protein